jgi:thiosulfate dehydrogenase
MMFRAFFAGVLVTIVAILVCGYFSVRNGLVSADADATPMPMEIWAAKTSLRATLHNEAPVTPNPIALTDENLIAGIDLYGQHCAICHGTAKGESAASPLAKGLYPHPPQLATDGVEDDPEGFSFWKVKHGIRWTGMPAWRDTLNDQQIWTLALFLKHMDKLSPAAQQAWQNVGN